MRGRVFEFNAGVLGGEAPVDLAAGLVAAQGPRGDFLTQGVLGADATGQALSAQHAQLDLGDV